MNKTKKIAFAAIAVVMAGTFALSLGACAPQSSDDPSADLEAGFIPNVDGEGKLDYAEGTVLRMNVGYQNKNNPARIEFNENELKQTVTLPDGNQYSSGKLKPAWDAAGKELKITFEEAFENLENEAQLQTPIQGGQMGNYDLITSSAAAMTQNTDVLLNITPYLDYMPNYKHFLESNTALYYSLTSDTDNGAMYYAPYFDGFNDIEKYALAEKTWLDDVLNATADDLAKMEKKSLDAIQERGGAQVGDKTMVDALAPAVDALAANAGKGLLEMLKAAEEAARCGMEDTKKYVAKFGRAKSLLERAIGHQDAGATSVYLIFQGMREFVEGAID